MAKKIVKKAVAKKPAAKPAPKKAAPAKKVAAKPAPKKPAAKPAPKKVAAKPAAKKVAAKPAPKKSAPAKKVAAKPAPKKVAAPAKKVVAKPAPKKATPAKKVVAKPAAKPAPKKVAPAKKVVAKPAPAPKKVAAPVKKAAPVKAEKPAKPPKPVKPPKPAKVEKVKVVKPKPKPEPFPDPRRAPELKPQAFQRGAKAAPVKDVKVPKTSVKTSVPYNPGYVPLEKRVEVAKPSDPLVRYSDNELNEFRDLINRKLESSKKELAYLQGLITRKDEMGGDETDNRYMTMEDGSMSMEREQLSQMASRQITYIDHLEKALIRIENKTYGICRVTGKLIDKARLRAVPHATLSLEAKLGLVKPSSDQ